MMVESISIRINEVRNCDYGAEEESRAEEESKETLVESLPVEQPKVQVDEILDASHFDSFEISLSLSEKQDNIKDLASCLS